MKLEIDQGAACALLALALVALGCLTGTPTDAENAGPIAQPPALPSPNETSFSDVSMNVSAPFSEEPAPTRTIGVETTAPAGPERPVIEILQCDGSRQRKERERCYDAFIAQKMHFKNAAELLAEMDAAANAEARLRIACHDVAHAIGRNTFYRSNGSISTAFQQCVQTCHAGCYHGTLQAFFLDRSNESYYDAHLSEGQMRSKVKTACNEFEGQAKNDFQCLHGMGHAIEFFVENNLTLALDICDELPTTYQRQSCHGGIFMENVVSVNRESRWIKLDDPLYPCNILANEYKYQCYLMQTSIVQEIYGEDDERVIETCKRADAGYVNTCFASFGRDRSNYFRINSDRPYRDLEKIAEREYRVEYVRGLIYALLDNTWDGFYAFPFCSKIQDQLQDSELKTSCYRMATGYLRVNLGSAASEVETSCREHAPEEDGELCILGAA